MRPLVVLAVFVSAVLVGALLLYARALDRDTARLGCRPMLPGHKIWVCPTPSPFEVP